MYLTGNGLGDLEVELDAVAGVVLGVVPHHLDGWVPRMSGIHNIGLQAPIRFR